MLPWSRLILDQRSVHTSVPRSLKWASWDLSMKRKWQISDILQFNLLPFRNINAEKTDLNFSCLWKNSPSSPIANTLQKCCSNITFSFPVVVSSLVRLAQSCYGEHNPSKKNPSGFQINYKCCLKLSLFLSVIAQYSFSTLPVVNRTKPQCKGFPSLKHILQEHFCNQNFTDWLFYFWTSRLSPLIKIRR